MCIFFYPWYLQPGLLLIYIHVVYINSLFFTVEYPIISICHNFFIHSCVSRYLGFFKILALISKVAVNILVQVFVGTYIFISLVNTQSGIIALYGKYVFSFYETVKLFFSFFLFQKNLCKIAVTSSINMFGRIHT